MSQNSVLAIGSEKPKGDALDGLIGPFIESVRHGFIEVYNEFSLQHELGTFLRSQWTTQLIQFERNVRHFFPATPPNSFTKREIDIAVYSAEPRCLEWAIELKYPRNGQHPEQMFSFCKDVAFAEELKAAGFRKAAFVVFAEDELFWRGTGEGIYSFFRRGVPLNGLVIKPTGARDAEVRINGSYLIEWKPIAGRLHYAAIEVETIS